MSTSRSTRVRNGEISSNGLRDRVPPPEADHHGDADLDPGRVREAIAVVERLAADRPRLDALPAADRRRLHAAVAGLYDPDPVARRHRLKAAERARRAAAAERDTARLDETGIRRQRRTPEVTTPNVFPPDGFTPDDLPADRDAGGRADAGTRARHSTDLRHCYVCKNRFTEVHHFYDQLCPSCADLNFAKRTELADLSGRTALLTGGRVKIGYQAGLKLLRSGARLIVTTRFPHDCAARYAEEPDAPAWRDRLDIFGLDLRHTPSVEAFCRHLLDDGRRLDFIVNNACQTVRRPPAFYAHMMTAERAAALPGARGAGLVRRVLDPPATSAELSQVPLLPEDLQRQPDLFPAGRLDLDRQQVDLRDRNSWRMLLADVPTVELLEVHLVNAVAPFLFNARLKPLLAATPERDKHIVNVSAMEGQFYRRFKTTRHPHTNMAKAALNMMTRTSATDYHGDGIHMNSVDTGWITDEDPAEIAARKQREMRFHPPLDSVDGAARILDPVIDGFNTGRHVWGQFLKDFRPTDW